MCECLLDDHQILKHVLRELFNWKRITENLHILVYIDMKRLKLIDRYEKLLIDMKTPLAKLIKKERNFIFACSYIDQTRSKFSTFSS